MTRTRDKN